MVRQLDVRKFAGVPFCFRIRHSLVDWEQLIKALSTTCIPIQIQREPHIETNARLELQTDVLRAAVRELVQLKSRTQLRAVEILSHMKAAKSWPSCEV